MPSRREPAHLPHQAAALVGSESGSRARGGGSSGRATAPRAAGSARIQARASESVPASTPARSASQTPSPHPFLPPSLLPPTLLPRPSSTTTPSAATATTTSAGPIDAEGLTWFCDTTFELRPPHKRTGSRYTFVTLALDHSRATILNVNRLLTIYSDRWDHHCRTYTALRRSTPDDDDSSSPITATTATAAAADTARQCLNVMEHLQVLWDLRGNRERWLRKLAGILEPETQRTFVFRLVRTWEGEEEEGIWAEVERGAGSAGRRGRGRERGRGRAAEEREWETERVWEVLRSRGVVS